MEQIRSATRKSRRRHRTKSSANQINQAIEHISQMAYPDSAGDHQRTVKGVQQILAAVERVKILTEKNMESSSISISHLTADLTTQAQILLQAVDRFSWEPPGMLRRSSPSCRLKDITGRNRRRGDRDRGECKPIVFGQPGEMPSLTVTASPLDSIIE